MFLQFLYPCSRSGNLVKIKHVGVDYSIQIYIAIITFYDFCLRLYSADNLFYPSQFLWFYVCSLVQQYDITEFNLLDYEVFYIILVQILIHQLIAVGKFVLHSHCIHYGYYTVHLWHTVLHVLSAHSRDRTYCLSNWSRFTYTAGFYNYIVKFLLSDYIGQLFYEIHLQRTADAAVLQSYERFVLLIYDAAFLNQVSIDIYLAYIVYYNCESDSFLV